MEYNPWCTSNEAVEDTEPSCGGENGWAPDSNGTAVSILLFGMYNEKFKQIPLNETAARLKTYTGERVQPQGQLSVKVEKDKVVQHLTFIVVDGPGPPLLGRDWLSKIPINWNAIKRIHVGADQHRIGERNRQLEALLIKYPNTQNQKL